MGLGVFHHHPFTGLPCECAYGRPKFLRRSERTAGVNWNRAVKTQVGGKKFQMLEGAQAFVGWMNELMQDDPNGWRDEIAPFLVKEFRAGNITFDENRRAFMRTDHGEQAIGHGIADRWGRWAAARQHPTRRGVNITGPDLTTMNIGWKVDPFYQDMQERERKQQQIEAMQTSDAPVVYQYKDGWTVRDLAQADYPGEEMELEGQVMDHCIGNHGEHPHNGYSYIDAVDGGDIPHVYSIRDPEGIPHVTLHLNTDGSLAEVHGFNDQDDALRKYAPRVAHFLRDEHPQTLKPEAHTYDAEEMHSGRYPWQAVGNRFENPNEGWDDETGEHEDDEEPEEEENPYLDDYEVRAPSSVNDVYDMHEAINSEGDQHDYIRDNVSPDYYTAQEEGHSPDLSFLGPQWGEVVHDMNTLFAGGDEERDDVREFIAWLRKNDRRWLEHLRTAVGSSGTDELQAELAHQDREAEIQRKVNEMFPGAEDPNPLFHTLLEDSRGRSVGDPWSEDQYTYPVTDQSLALPEQYLNPSTKQLFINQDREKRMKGMRDEGHSWDDVRREFGAGGYADETNPAQASLNAVRQEEYQAMRMKQRDFRRFVQNREETDAPRHPTDPDRFIPYTMDDVQNKARQLHWQEMVNGGLHPDAASQRMIDYERIVRNNPEHCQVCGDFGGGHARDCPNRAENLQGRLGPPGPAGGGTLSRVAMAFPGDLYHVSPAANRQAIMSEGLRAHERGAVPMFNPTGFGQGIPGNYAFEHEKDALFYAQQHARSQPMDIWRLRNTGALPVEQDPESYMFGQGDEIAREEAPQPHDFQSGGEMGLGEDEDPPHNPTYYWWRPQPEHWDEEEDGPWREDEDSLTDRGLRQVAWRIPKHVPPEQLQHVRHVNPGDTTWEEHWMGDYPAGWDPSHMAPEPFHRVDWGSPQEYQQAVQQWHDQRDKTSGAADEFIDGLDKIPGVRRLTPVPNRSIEHNVGDRVVSEYNSPLAPDEEVPSHLHGMNLNAGTIIAKHPPGTYRVYADDPDGGFEVTHDEPSYHVRWDLGADWNKLYGNPYFTPGRVGEHLPQSRLWPEGHEALEHGLTDPKDPKSLDLMYPPADWGEADPSDAEPWS